MCYEWFEFPLSDLNLLWAFCFDVTVVNHRTEHLKLPNNILKIGKLKLISSVKNLNQYPIFEFTAGSKKKKPKQTKTKKQNTQVAFLQG